MYVASLIQNLPEVIFEGRTLRTTVGLTHPTVIGGVLVSTTLVSFVVRALLMRKSTGRGAFRFAAVVVAIALSPFLGVFVTRVLGTWFWSESGHLDLVFVQFLYFVPLVAGLGVSIYLRGGRSEASLKGR